MHDVTKVMKSTISDFMQDVDDIEAEILELELQKLKESLGRMAGINPEGVILDDVIEPELSRLRIEKVELEKGIETLEGLLAAADPAAREELAAKLRKETSLEDVR